MRINADFEHAVALHTGEIAWQASPMAGVERRMLDRVGKEVARATSIVRYAPDSQFSSHVHSGGEEFIVLSGVFQDEHGDYPAGHYIRNPPTSSHVPRSKSGCIIFVKLWQFDPFDRQHVNVDMNNVKMKNDPLHPQIQSALLHEDAREIVATQIWPADLDIAMLPVGGAEILVLDGSILFNGDVLTQHDWIRIPIDAPIIARAGSEGACIWMKTGHLRFANDFADDSTV